MRTRPVFLTCFGLNDQSKFFNPYGDINPRAGEMSPLSLGGISKCLKSLLKACKRNPTERFGPSRCKRSARSVSGFDVESQVKDPDSISWRSLDVVGPFTRLVEAIEEAERLYRGHKLLLV